MVVVPLGEVVEDPPGGALEEGEGDLHQERLQGAAGGAWKHTRPFGRRGFGGGLDRQAAEKIGEGTLH